MIPSQELDKKQFFQPVVETISQTLGLPACIWLADETGETLRIAAATELSEEYVRDAFLRLDEPSVASDVFATEQAIVVTDVDTDARWKYKPETTAMGLKSAMVVPLRVKRKIVGVLDVYTREARDFTDFEKALIESSSAQVAATQRRIQDLATLNAVSLLISSELRRADLFARIMQAAERVLDCKHISVFLVDKSGDLALEAASSAGIARQQFAQGVGLAGWVAQTKQSELVPDAVKHPQFVPGLSSDIVERSMVLAPIILQDEVIGVISADMDGLSGFDEHDQMLLEAVASQSAVAVHNAQLLEQATSRAAVLQRLHQIGGRILSAELSAQGLREVLRQVARSARSVLGADLVDVYQYVEADDRYIMPPILEGERRDPTVVKDEIFKDDVVVKVVEGGEPLYSPDTQTDTLLTGPFTVERPERPEKRFVVREGILSSAAVPLEAAGETVGAMFVNYRSRQPFTPEQRGAIELFANQAATAIYNARVYEEAQTSLQERIDDIRALQNLYALIGTASLEDLLEQIAEQAARLTPAKYTSIWLLDERTRELRFGARNKRDETPTRTLTRLPLDETSINGHVALSRKTYLCNDIKSDPYYKEWFEEVQSELTTPLIHRDRVIGTLNLESTQIGAFTDDHMRLVEALAGAAAVAIKSARLYKAIQAVNEVGQTLTSGIRLKQDEILELIYEQARELTGAQDMYIALYDEETGMIRFGLATEHGEQVHYDPRKADMEKRGKTEEVILTKKPILHRTQVESKAWYGQPGHQEFIGRVQPSYLGVPMVTGEKVLGMIAIYDWEREQAYDEQDLQVISSVANQAAIALDNATLYYEINQQLARRVQALAALNEVGQALTSGIRLKQDEILELIYEQARELTGAQDMYIALYDEETGMIRFGLATEHGEQVHYDPRKADMEKRGKTEEVILTKKPILHRTQVESKAWYGQPGHQEFIGRVAKSWIGVPMVLENRVLGVIAIYDWEREQAYDEQDLQVISSMANQAAIALENARLYEEARSEVIATKRLATLGTAIAALQHRVNNTFNIIVPNVTRLRKRVDMSNDTIAEILDIIERNARYTSDIIARIQEPLREVEDQDVDINAVLSDVVGKVREQWRTDPIRSTIEHTLDLDQSLPQIRAPIGQIAEVFYNLVDNAYRAMKAGGQLAVTSRLTDSNICVRVQDTGPGIPLQVQQRLFVKPVPSKEPGGGAGLGLWLSRLMLQSIGGDAIIEETDPTGTTMLVQIPAPGTGKEV